MAKLNVAQKNDTTQRTKGIDWDAPTSLTPLQRQRIRCVVESVLRGESPPPLGA